MILKTLPGQSATLVHEICECMFVSARLVMRENLTKRWVNRNVLRLMPLCVQTVCQADKLVSLPHPFRPSSHKHSHSSGLDRCLEAEAGKLSGRQRFSPMNERTNERKRK